MTDDLTGEPLIQRSDDNVETLRKRLTTYHQVRLRPPSSSPYFIPAVPGQLADLFDLNLHLNLKLDLDALAANRPRRRLLPQDRHLGWDRRRSVPRAGDEVHLGHAGRQKVDGHL